MRDAETVLDVIRKRGERGLHLNGIYRMVYNPDLYLRAYGRLYKNQGAMTKGATSDTVDGMSLAKIDSIISHMRDQRYRWKPARRLYIPKANGQQRPLGIPTWSDKLVQEVIRSILEAYYEPHFSSTSHGFRPDKGCHTALLTVQRTWKGMVWFIEGDIKGCFDNIDHTVLLEIIREKIHDGRFLKLIGQLLKAGYLEDWIYKPTRSGTPQGGVISPILANIYLDKLDRYVEDVLRPKYSRGEEKARNPEYYNLSSKARKLTLAGRTEDARQCRLAARRIPSVLVNDPDYRKLKYIRYADDFLLGFTGPKEEAECIKADLKAFVRDHLKLELSEDKTLITHAKNDRAKFLGYELQVMHSETRKSVNGHIALYIPEKAVLATCSRYQRDGKPTHRPELSNDSDFTIVERYGSEYRGVVQYYGLASNLRKMARVHWVLKRSLLMTLANKHKTSTLKLLRKYESRLVDSKGVSRAC